MNSIITKPCHVLLIVGDPSGGIRRHVHSIIKGLDTQAYTISYVYDASAADKTFQQEINVLQTQLAHQLNLSVHKAPHPSDLINIYKLYQFVRLHGVDIIHGHGAKAGLYARVVSRLTGKKSVYTPHGGSAHDMFKWPMSWIYQTMERLLASITDYFIFESAYTSQAMTQRLGYQPSNSVVNPNGIENCTVEKNTLIQAQTKLVEIDPLTPCRFAVFGMLRPQKGQHIAIEALALLKEKGVKASLHLFGQGSSQADLQQQAESLGLSQCVLFHGDVSPVEPWMQAVDVILIPSLFESFGYVAVEAMMLSCPLIVSKTGGLVDVVGEDYEYFFLPNNAVMLADVMASMALNPNAEAVAANYQRAKTLFLASTMLNGIMAVYQRLYQLSKG
ncbi:MAG: glycosyltransferase family 4 protein [Moraxellaceae bacterium]|nr:glycosyltransferase family 4 protein [Moraxellaceae bacterium]